MFFPVEEWFAAFLLTIGIEIPIVVLLLRRAEPELARRAAIALFANSRATRPSAVGDAWLEFLT